MMNTFRCNLLSVWYQMPPFFFVKQAQALDSFIPRRPILVRRNQEKCGIDKKLEESRTFFFGWDACCLLHGTRNDDQDKLGIQGQHGNSGQ
jgi:hypothetical protein